MEDEFFHARCHFSIKNLDGDGCGDSGGGDGCRNFC